MAYGLKYFVRYRDVAKVVKEIRFFKDGYSGAVTEWIASYGVVDFNMGSSDAMFGKMIVTSQAKIGLILTEHYDLTEFVFDRKTFFVEVLIPNEDPLLDKILWSGWVEPWDAARPYQKPPYQVSVTASCGLAHLAKKKYSNPDNVFKKTGLKIIQECLAIIGSELGLRVSTHMYENSWTGDDRLGLNSFEINTARYYNQNGEALNCAVILEDILNKFNAELLQWDNRWVVRSIVDNATGMERSFVELPFNGGPAIPASPWPNTYILNDAGAFTLDGGQIRVLAPITKYRTEVDLGEQIPYFENGNMVLWTIDGLVGWDFSHMPKGSPGWERDYLGGDPDNASVLKISGKAPGPYEKKKKKTLRQILGQGVIITTLGIVQYTVDNKSYHIEPSEWIESPVGRISPGDKKITISFDYETEPFSSNIIIALRFPSATNPAITYWSQPFQENTPASQTYKWIIVPPLNREGVIGRGHIDVSGNPNYPAGNIVGWTYVIYGVPPGQTRRIGGPSGVIVENDDIIISKVSNPGGTQAAVGTSWDVINIRVNIQKGTFEIPIELTAANARMPIPVEEVFIRFYKITEHPDKTGDWYKIHNLKGTIEGFVAKDEASKYATTLERGSKTDEEAEKISLITGDYNPWYSGSLTIPGTTENTKSWRRRPDLEEELSIYRAMMLDRLCLTSPPLTVMEGPISLVNGSADLSYLHTIILSDMGNMRMRIVRYSYNDYLRKALVTAIEVKYEEIPKEELRQDSYIPGSRLLNPVSGQGDGIYPTKQDSTSGRLNAEEPILTNEEMTEVIGSSGRIGAIFDITDPLTYIENETSISSVNLSSYVTAAFDEINEDQEEDDIFDLDTLVWTITNKPTWLTDITIVFLNITAKAIKPPKGTYYLYYDVMDPESELVFEVKVPIRVLEQVKVTPTLINGLTSVKAGILPGSFKLNNPVEIVTTVKGYHNNVKLILDGPNGELMNEFINAPGHESELADYYAFPNTNGIEAVEGLYKFTVEVHSNMYVVSEPVYYFTLYTDTYLSKLKFELWNTVKIGDISIQDTSIFKPVAWFNPRTIVSDIEHDRAILTLYYEGDQIAQEIITHVTPVMSGTYDVYDTPQTGQGAGKYRINAILLLSSDEVMERQNDFVVLAKDPVAEGKIVYGTMTPNTANFNPKQDLPVTTIEIDLPTDGYNFEYTTVGGDYVRAEFLRKTGGVLSAMDVTKYTNQPDFVTFSEATIGEKVYPFRGLSSLEIGDLHAAPSSVRVRFTERLGGPTGAIISIAQADVNFRVPVDPGDLAGLRFIHIHNVTGEVLVIDPNMKKVGGVYALPVYPWLWSVAFRKLSTGLEFDNIIGDLERNGVELHKGISSSAYEYKITPEKGYPGSVTTELDTDVEAHIFGDTIVGGQRNLLNPSNANVNIDVPGNFIHAVSVYRLGTPMEILSAAFELKNAEDLPETPEEDGDCCKCKTFTFTSLAVWDIPHNMDKTPDITVFIDDEEVWSDIKKIDSNNSRVTHLFPETGYVIVC